MRELLIETKQEPLAQVPSNRVKVVGARSLQTRYNPGQAATACGLPPRTPQTSRPPILLVDGRFSVLTFPI